MAQGNALYGAKRGRGETRALVLALARDGRSVRDIARSTDISDVAVRKHIRRLRADGELPEEGAA